MAFIELIPNQRTHYKKNNKIHSQISIAFYNSKEKPGEYYKMNIKIPNNIAKKYGFNIGDKINIALDKKNVRKILLRKTPHNGYYLCALPGTKFYILQARQSIFTPDPFEFGTNYYDCSKYKGGMLINITPPCLERDPNQLIG